MKFGRRIALVVSCAALLAPVAVAHHAFEPEYDVNKPVTVSGVVTKIEWTNPHVRFYVDAPEEGGRTTNWNFELGSLNSMRRRGWTKDSLQIGAQVTVSGYRARAGTPMASASAVTLANGKALFAADTRPAR